MEHNNTNHENDKSNDSDIELEIAIIHKCNCCNTELKSFYEWTEHIKTFHIENTTNHPCTCTETYNEYKQLLIHFHDKHYHKITVCPCGKRFESTEDMKEATTHIEDCNIRGSRCGNCVFQMSTQTIAVN